MPIYRDKESGRFVFEFDRRVAKRRVRARKFLPKEWNRAKADAFDRAESARLYGQVTGVERVTFSIEQAVEAYCTERLPELKVGKRTARELALIHWAYKGKDITELADVCRAITEQDSDRLAPATIRNRIRYLTAACRFAYKHHGMAESDPAERVRVPTVKNDRQYYMTRRDMLIIAHAFKPTYKSRVTNAWQTARAAFRAAFYSGLRRGEICAAEVSDGLFKLADSKNGEPRYIPIHPRIAVCVRAYFPFRLSPGTLTHKTKQAMVDAGYGEMRFHDSRHSAASAMINADVDLYTVGAVLGHKSAQSTKRYAHLATRTLADAVRKIGQNIPHHSKTKAA